MLLNTINSVYWNFYKKGERVLEVMSGIGRNYPVLKGKFDEIEMLEGSKLMMSDNKHDVIRHEQRIENFEWPEYKYECVVGVFCLGYLSGDDLVNALIGMRKSLKYFGRIILMEPILNETEDVDEKDHHEIG